MTVSLLETEIRSQPHEMWAEGTSDKMPESNDIVNMLSSKGWYVYDIEKWHDDLQGFYRWNCKIEELK